MPTAGDPISNLVRWEIIRGHADFVRLARSAAGTWWLLDPEDRPFVSRGVARIRTRVGDLPDNFSLTVAAKFARWHCNTVGLESARGLRPAEAWDIVPVPFCSAFLDTTIRAGGLCVPDVFDARWQDGCRGLATEAGGGHGEDRRVLAYCIDGGVQWEPSFVSTKAGARPKLLQVCLSLEPGFPAYHAAWEFVLAAHGGDWDRLLRDWAVAWPNREALRQTTRDETALATPGFLRDQDNFLREFSRRYFHVAVEALRAADPHHLIMAGQAAMGRSEIIRGAMTSAEVDVLALNFVDLAEGDTLEATAGEGRAAVMITDFSWTPEKFRRAGAAPKRVVRSGVEAMLADGRAALVRLQQHAAVVGYLWSDWQDAPGQRAPYGCGLLRENGDEALEHTELFSLLNAGAEKKRRAAERRSRLAGLVAG